MTKAASRLTRILLVEDNPADRALFLEVMRASEPGINVSMAVTGEMALAFLDKSGEFTNAQTPQLIVLDLNLPGISGLEVLEHISAKDELRSIPVVVFSTSNSPQDIEKSYSGNANCYMVKPAKLDDYFQAVNQIKNYWFGFVALPNQAPRELDSEPAK